MFQSLVSQFFTELNTRLHPSQQRSEASVLTESHAHGFSSSVRTCQKLETLFTEGNTTQQSEGHPRSMPPCRRRSKAWRLRPRYVTLGVTSPTSRRATGLFVVTEIFWNSVGLVATGLCIPVTVYKLRLSKHGLICSNCYKIGRTERLAKNQEKCMISPNLQIYYCST